jgi:Undecaprenyl-phosphate galactose phosphotransferase WbaP
MMFPSAQSAPPIAERPSLILMPAHTGLLRPGARQWKRVVDMLLGAALLVAVLPLALLIALAIVLDSPGPVFFAQRRIGQGGRRFRLWKFRSMLEGADEVLRNHLKADPDNARQWRLARKLRNDPRVTRVGRFLRRTSLDELPQLWNVLRGDMSLVGPRPIVCEEIRRYGAAFALYRQVSPGLTGLWQVSGRNDTSYHRRVVLDACYVRTWTPILDLIILLKTIPVVLAGKGAY